MVENLRNMNFQQAGYNSHLSSGIMTDADVEKITTHEAVRDFGKSIVVGITENKELTGRQVEIRYGDENYARSSFSYPTEGTMPVQENEIALDTITLDKMGLPYELGQEITLQWRKDLNGEEITTSTFTLSGYWDGNSAAMASMAWVSEAFVQSQCARASSVTKCCVSGICEENKLGEEERYERDYEADPGVWYRSGRWFPPDGEPPCHSKRDSWKCL